MKRWAFLKKSAAALAGVTRTVDSSRRVRGYMFGNNRSNHKWSLLARYASSAGAGNIGCADAGGAD